MKKTTKKDEFELVNLPKECSDPSISKDDFKLVQVDTKIHDQKFETKPTTFLKDCIKRFRKNKSSVVAAFILGFLILLSLVVPTIYKIFDTTGIHDTSFSHPDLYYLEPRLFNAGTGFWDGTKKYSGIPVDPETGYPDANIFEKGAIVEGTYKVGDKEYIDGSSDFAEGGYLQFGYYSLPKSIPHVSLSTSLVVGDMISPDPKPTYPQITENMRDIVINNVIHPDFLQQKSKVDIEDFAVEITYTDYSSDPEQTGLVGTFAVKEVELNTNKVKEDVTGSVKISNGLMEYTAEFQIDIVSKIYEKMPFNQALKITNFVTLDSKALSKTKEQTKEYPKGYSDAKSALYLVFQNDPTVDPYSVPLTEYKPSHDIGGKEPAIDVLAKFDEFRAEKGILSNEVVDVQLEMRVENEKDGKNRCTLVKSINIVSGSDDPDDNPVVKEQFESYSFKDGNSAACRNKGLWLTIDPKTAAHTKNSTYLVKARLCSFVYDTYEAVLGAVTMKLFNRDLEKMVQEGSLDFDCTVKKDEMTDEYVVTSFYCEILDKKKCPLVEEFKITDIKPRDDAELIEYVTAKVYRYKMDPYNLDEMPKFLLGTDKTGRDMFVYVFEGLRTSLLLGIATSAVCFLFGLLWGSIAGYFGGNVDLIMERFTDILAGVPWIVVMTLTIIHLGSTFFTFALALCLTGWIGTAATTRTQFYRFRGREYVLASRTLGASHARLITKHILPNAMGTIITSAVLMVPSIIFSEATISYLGLGFKNLASLGVILSDNQVELTNNPYLLIFPSIIIALLMISFNLFGNGLRDAVNPSLKGEGE